jgi:hypothetical protein
MLVKEVPSHQGRGGSVCSSSLAKYVTPPSHQHPILCDPPSHGATRPAVLPGPGHWFQCPVYCPASSLAAGMPCPVLSHDPTPPSTKLPQSLSPKVICEAKEGMTLNLRILSSVKSVPTHFRDLYWGWGRHFAD